MAVERPWAHASGDVAEELGSDIDTGLTASEVEARRERYGPNRLREAEQRSRWVILWDQVKSVIVALLAIAIVVSLAFGHVVEAVAIGVVIVINAAIGFFTELRAVRSMESLQALGQADSKVRRDGEVRELPAVELVPGDIVVLERGEVLGADVRILEVDGLQVDESPLTGESVPVTKQVEPVDGDAPLAERASMAYKGTAVTRGAGLGVVVRTGMETEIGEISEMAGAAEAEETPLERRLDTLGRRLVWLTIAVAAVVAVTGIVAGRDVFLMIETGIALAVAAVPEGLPIVATIALARGVRRMARRNALIRRLSSVETLGSTTVICADKTGTLTENRMDVVTLALPHGRFDVDDGDQAPFEADGTPTSLDDDPLLERAVRVAVLANEVEALDQEDPEDGPGDPMELALLRLGRDAGLSREELLERYPRVRVERFERETAMMASFHEREGGALVAVKGAPEAVLDASTSVASAGGEEGRDEAMTDDARARWLERSEELAGEGLRVLGLAAREADRDGDPYRDLVFLGLLGMMDPAREGVAEAVGECRSAGIRVVMVTGDHPETARQIAADVGISEGSPEVVTGEELASAEEGSGHGEVAASSRVFARVDPAQKLRLIDAFQERGEILAMTGDGVNDAPALKRADIGIAMGDRGTEVAREAADMVLLDDAFSTIVEAVRHGRVIFRNVRKFVVYLLSGNVGEILAVGAASAVGAPLPLLPLQILYLNLVNDVFPALALGVGQGEGHVMKEPPRDPEESILTARHWRGIGGYGVLIAVAILGAFFWALEGLRLPVGDAVTTSFLVLSGARLLHVFNMRDARSHPLRNEVTRNPWVWGAIGLCVALLALALYVPPLAGVLSLTPPSGAQWLLILGGSAFPLVAGQAWQIARARLGERG